MITIKEIASLANVSGATVSRVLNSSGYVSEDVRSRVLKIIEEHHYIPSEHAKSLRTKQTKVIGVIIPKLSTESASRVVDGINEELAAHGYQIILAASNLDPQKEIEFLKLLRSRQVEGIILNATNVDPSLVKEIKRINIPFVAVGQKFADESYIVYDNYNAAKELTLYLIKQGHENVAFIGVNEKDEAVGSLRKQGYKDAMKENKLHVETGLMKEALFGIQPGFNAMQSIMENAVTKPTALLAVTDRLAVGAMRYLKKAGYSIPTDVAVAGIGASEISENVDPALTTIDFKNEEAGRQAAKLILNKIRTKDNTTKKIVLGYRLLIRDSV
ncbi:LacI family DNA-binding transcriptional regulator [Sinobaca sp. H24]|uniref:LacI family DNA-binding transcriptional regulator n=1 Tax=Sinobaca sp. H24 TaxID=2923376 RepID=UPI00207AA401|nr:LacI family DNA-binding transcriptional regulator [Sinobaca sp. H24]